eukprot:1367393-Alexandrium_andersonii.AAC.1
MRVNAPHFIREFISYSECVLAVVVMNTADLEDGRAMRKLAGIDHGSDPPAGSPDPLVIVGSVVPIPP